MDLQYAAVISYPIETIYFSVNGTPPFLSNSNPLNSHDPFLDFLDFVFFFSFYDVRWWSEEVRAVGFILMVRSQK